MSALCEKGRRTASHTKTQKQNGLEYERKDDWIKPSELGEISRGDYGRNDTLITFCWSRGWVSFLGLDLEEVCESVDSGFDPSSIFICLESEFLCTHIKTPTRLETSPTGANTNVHFSYKEYYLLSITVFYICLVTNLIFASARHLVTTVLKFKHFSPSLFTNLKS